MSYMTIKTVQVNGDVVNHTMIRNAGRGALMLWDYLAKTYISEWEGYWLAKVASPEGKKLWELMQNKDVPKELRILHAATFDRVIVKISNLSILIKAMEYYCEISEDPGHYPEQIKILKEIDEYKVLGICWQGTSVSDDLWLDYDECSTCGQESDECRPYNINKDEGHWYLFDEYPELRNGECSND